MDAPPVPEPGGAALFGSGLLGLWLARRRATTR
ncbi:MAG: PEP-CTERM sorting domain-containing protein [Proteobacteria bacterium]|nr:PEP-CTERM sorting domain-containing protein [Pseudomonadota bacterium]